MRTKKLLLLAAMLLSGVCATFSQSENEHPLAFILGTYDAQGETWNGLKWGRTSWTTTIEKDETDPNKVWINQFISRKFTNGIYGIVNEDKTEIRIPVHQYLGSNQNKDVFLEAWTDDEDITDFIVGTISPVGIISISPTTVIGAAAYNSDGTPSGGYYSIDREYVFIKQDPSGIVLNEENFPDANFRKALARKFGINEGDDFLLKHILTKELDVSYEKIKDLTGIELFTELTKLSCGYNQLTSLDVSKNTALTELWCDNNQLTSLDVSKNTALDKLWCSHNQLTALDVSQNTALKDLSCGVTPLMNIDLSKNTELISLSLFSNQLTELDLSKNTKLENLDVGNYANVDSPKNKISSLDLSKNTALKTVNFQMLGLTSLDVSANTALTELRCAYNQLTSLDVSKNTALDELWCSDNQLTALDVSQNTALTWLEISYNPLTTFDVFQNTGLRHLGCSGLQLTSLDVSMHTALERLACSNNQLTSLDVSKNTALDYLACDGNQLTSLDVSQNTALTSLDCEDNQLTSLDVSNNTALKCLRCNDNQLTALDVSKNTALTELYCYNNQIKGEAMEALVNGLPTVRMGWFFVIDTKNENEGNVCTKSQVAVAKEKGWMVFDSNWSNYEGSDPVEENIDPVDEDDNIDFGSDMDENDDLDGNVIGDIYYNINTGNGGYNAAEGCIVVKKPTDDGTVNDLEGKDIFGEDFKSQFTGIVFKVPAGKGTIKVNAETTGNMLLKVKIGSNDPVEMELNGKLKVTFPYNVSETTYVYIYAGAANEAKGFGTTNDAEDAALKIYGIEFIRDETTAIDASLNDNGQRANDSWYTIDGVKLNGEPKKKGIYIYKGKKVKK